MNDDQFTQLFTYMEKRFDEITQKLDQKAGQSSLDYLINTIDAFVARLDTYDIGQAARDTQFTRLIEWTRQVSAKTGIPLPDL